MLGTAPQHSKNRFWSRAKAELKGLVWPAECVACRAATSSVLCDRCAESGALPADQQCWVSPAGLSIVSLGRADGPWRKVVHGLKYGGQFSWPQELLSNASLSELLPSQQRSTVWLPVPLHHSRKRERGYNQSELIARCCAQRWGGRVEAKGLKRLHTAVSQTKLTAQERRKNVALQFAVASAKMVQRLKDAQIVLVDDVTTTGATLESCVAALEKEGLSAVMAITLLRAVQSQDDFEAELWRSASLQ